MTISDLQKRIAEVLGVSSSEKELAFNILIPKIADNLEADLTLKIPRIGFFQLKEGEDIDKTSLIFTPFSEDVSKSTRTLYLTIDVPGRSKKDPDSDADVFSIGVGKPLIPLSDKLNPQSESETSYIILKRSIEERVNEIITESDNLPNFNIWDDYYESLDSNQNDFDSQSKLTELTSDLEFKEDIIAEEITNNLLELDSPKDVSTSDEFETALPELTPSDLLEDYDVPGILNDIPEKDSTGENELNEDTGILEIDNSSVENSTSSEDLQELIKDYEDEKSEDIEFNKLEKTETSKNTDPDIPEETLTDQVDSIILPDEDEETFLGLKKKVVDNIDWNWGDELKEELGPIHDDDEKPLFEFDDDDSFEEDDSRKDLFKTAKPSSTRLFDQLEDSIKKELAESDKETAYIEYTAPPPRYEFVEDRNFPETSPEPDSYLPEATPPTREYEEYNKEKYFSRNFLLIFGAFILIVSLIVYMLLPNRNQNQTDQTLPVSTQDSIVSGQLQASLPVDTATFVEDEISDFPRVASLPVMDKDAKSGAPTQKPVVTNPPAQSNRTNSQGDLYKSPVSETRIGSSIYYDGTNYNVQASSWRNKEKAELEVKRLRNLGLNAFILEAYLPQKGGTWYRVRIGQFKTKEEAESFESQKNF
ncbi:MAG TPA: SPOR domain-containing protein [Melioribacteraceae bacterium]|nr:SPOR domain-containing protein [Melioribacteraceae bacterium]